MIYISSWLVLTMMVSSQIRSTILAAVQYSGIKIQSKNMKALKYKTMNMRDRIKYIRLVYSCIKNQTKALFWPILIWKQLIKKRWERSELKKLRYSVKTLRKIIVKSNNRILMIWLNQHLLLFVEISMNAQRISRFKWWKKNTWVHLNKL
jgi:hypothetical protein